MFVNTIFKKFFNTVAFLPRQNYNKIIKKGKGERFMPKTLKTVLKIFAVLIILVLIFAIGFIGWLTITEFNPDAVMPRPVMEDHFIADRPMSTEDSFKVLTFNIGYGNLGKESDFFMDGGKNVRNGDENLVLKNMEGIIGIIDEADADILLLQEVDESSKRSFFINERQMLWEHFGNEIATAQNYVCNYVPFPWPPIGKVDSGIVTLSDYDIEKADRISLPCPFSWPVSAANLKRCLLVSYHNLENSDKQLVVVNLHLEAYDDGEGKIAQTKMLWEVLKTEYEKGNYVIAGGDFNQTFPGAINKYPLMDPDFWTPGVLGKEAVPDGWSYVYDDKNPTCRLLNQPYNPKSTQHYVIDGFIISPNVKLLSVETMAKDFEFSDHNPVLMEIKLK